MQVMAARSRVPPNSKTWRPVSKSQTLTTWKQWQTDGCHITVRRRRCRHYVEEMWASHLWLWGGRMLMHSQNLQSSSQLDETPRWSRSMWQAHCATQSDGRCWTVVALWREKHETLTMDFFYWILSFCVSALKVSHILKYKSNLWHSMLLGLWLK